MKGTELMKLERLMKEIKVNDNILFDNEDGVFKIIKLEDRCSENDQ